MKEKCWKMLNLQQSTRGKMEVLTFYCIKDKGHGGKHRAEGEDIDMSTMKAILWKMRWRE